MLGRDWVFLLNSWVYHQTLGCNNYSSLVGFFLALGQKSFRKKTLCGFRGKRLSSVSNFWTVLLKKKKHEEETTEEYHTKLGRVTKKQIVICLLVILWDVFWFDDTDNKLSNYIIYKSYWKGYAWSFILWRKQVRKFSRVNRLKYVFSLSRIYLIITKRFLP